MTVLVWPDFRVARFNWNKLTRAAPLRSSFGFQSLVTGAPVWSVEMSGVSETRAEARQIQTFLESLDGYQNQLELWNLEVPQPVGTMRGIMTLSAAAAQGANTISISAGSGQAGKTLLRGDMVGIGSLLTQQVLRIQADAMADETGKIVVQIAAPLRNAFSAGASISWDRPKALFRQQTQNQGVTFTPEGGEPWSLSLIEDWRS